MIVSASVSVSVSVYLAVRRVVRATNRPLILHTLTSSPLTLHTSPYIHIISNREKRERENGVSVVSCRLSIKNAPC